VIDAEKLVFTLLTAFAPTGRTITPETDSESIGDLPLWTYNLIGDGQVGNGPGLYQFALDISVFAEGLDAAKAESDLVYDGVHGWDTNPLSAVVPGVGWVQDVSDNSFFSLVGVPQLTGRLVSQYAGSFALALRK
jgi:hypothetical protein